MQTLANRSRKKSNKLRVVEDCLHQLQAKDRQIEEQVHKRIEVQRQLDAIKLERTRKTWLLKKETENLEQKSMS
jgi:hypothetical protein